MGHGITERDGMWTVREPAWHGLGAVLDDYPTRAEAQAIAHPWEPVQEPVYQKVPFVRLHEHGSEFCEGPDCDLTADAGVEFEEVDGFKLNARSDNGYPLGVVTDTYEPVTNGEMYDIAEAIEGLDRGAVRFETGGSLKGGSKVWLLIRLNEPLVIKGDRNGAVIPYYALQNSHDGSGAFRGQATLTRIVCDNTAQAADWDSQTRGTEFVFRHTKNVKARIEEAQEALAGWRHSVREWHRISEAMVDMRITQEQQRAFVEEFIPMPPPHTVSDRVVANVEGARAELRGILEGPTCEGIGLTAYGLVQASIEYVEHYRRARSGESRFKRAYLDRSRVVADAVGLANSVAVFS